MEHYLMNKTQNLRSSGLMKPHLVVLELRLEEQCAVLESAGVKDVLAKSKGSANPHNLVKATLKALLELRDPRTIAMQRELKWKKCLTVNIIIMKRLQLNKLE